MNSSQQEKPFMNSEQKPLADEQRSVAAIYESGAIAGAYLDKRMQFSWQRMLHKQQIAILNRAIAKAAPASLLEVAPGPARLAVEMTHNVKGTMVENSEEMISIARQRLDGAGLSAQWKVLQGDAFNLPAYVTPESFDFAYTFRFLRHFRNPEREQLYANLRQSLKTGGLLVFDVVGEVVYNQVEARNPQRAAGEIPIYDVTYTAKSFVEEMKRNGFDVVALHPILKHFTAQSLLSYKLDDVVGPLIPPLLSLLELVPSGAPLEWVAVCRKR
jgi:SAM-dependent methyltransferase